MRNGIAKDSLGNKYWFKNEKLHRENGPAVEYANGLKKWWLNGIEYSKEDFISIVAKYKYKLYL